MAFPNPNCAAGLEVIMAEQKKADEYYFAEYEFRTRNKILSRKEVIDLLNSIAAKDAEIERLKSALDELAKLVEEIGFQLRYDAMPGGLPETEFPNKAKAMRHEIKQLRAAVKPKADRFRIIGKGDGHHYFVFDNNNEKHGSVASFQDKSEADQYVRDHQPKPVTRWVSRDEDNEYCLDIWQVKPQRGSKCFRDDNQDQTVIDSRDAAIFGIPAISPGECHCYSVLDGVWARVKEVNSD